MNRDDIALVLIVLKEDIADTISIHSISIMDQYKYNIFESLYNSKPVFRMFVNYDNIFDKKLESIDFDCILILEEWPDTRIIDRALVLRSKEVRVISNMLLDDYNIKYEYSNTIYGHDTYLINKKEINND